MTVTFLSRFGKKPMHFFGVLGTLMFMLGFILFAYIGGAKLYYMFLEIKAKNIAEMSGFYIALTSMIMGLQLFLAGFVGEMLSRQAHDRNLYHIAEEPVAQSKNIILGPAFPLRGGIANFNNSLCKAFVAKE